MSVRDDIFAFLSQRPPWQQDLARRLLRVGQLPEWELEEVLNSAKSAHGCAPQGVQVPALKPMVIDELPAPDRTGSARLTKFGGLQGVGAVREDHTLTFAAHGLTVVYGANGAGKSTYVSGLKAICRSVHGTPVLQSNVFADEPHGEQRGAHVVLDAGTSGAPFSGPIDLNAPTEHLGTRNIAVFDSACASLYLSRANRVEFVPAELKVLARLSETQKVMRERVQAEAEAVKKELPQFPQVAPATQVSNFVATLHPDASAADPAVLLKQAETLSTLSEDERATLAELRAVLAANASANGQKDAAAARGDATQARELATRLEDLADRVSVPAATELSRLAGSAHEVEEALALAAQQFASQSLEGVGSAGAWQQLWAAARSFSTQHAHVFPPVEGQPCPLCLQTLDGSAAQRMDNFERHVRSQLAEHEKRAAAQLQSALGRIDPQQTAVARTPFLGSLRDREPELHEQVVSLLAAVDARMAALREDPKGTPESSLSREVIESLRAWAAGRDQHAQQVLDAQDPANEQRLRGQLNELEARVHLETRLPDVERWLHRLAFLHALRQTWRALDHTNVSTLQGKLSKEMVTVDFRRVLDEERRALHIGLPVDLQPQTKLGTPHVTVALANTNNGARVETVVSEGEHRTLALAFFFAEIRMSKGDGGIILDDPCSSLDEERRSAIVKRLVELAKDRQVIVFTHDLALLFELQGLAPKRGVPTHFQHVWNHKGDVGRAGVEPPFSLMGPGDRLKALRKDLQSWDDAADLSHDEEWRRVDTFYKRLRDAWERAIEGKLFNGVVGRLQNGVKTDLVQDVFIDDDLRHAVDEGMTRCSRFVHDASERAVVPLPHKEDLEADVEHFSDFLKLVTSKRKAGKEIQPRVSVLD